MTSAPDPTVPRGLRRKRPHKDKVKATPVEKVSLDDSTLIELPEGLVYQRVYYIDGVVPKHVRGVWPAYLIKNPPNSGHSFAFVLGRSDAKRVTIFCPFTLESSTVRADAGELMGRESEVMTECRLAYLVKLIHTRWAECQARGYQRDYAVATDVLRRLGASVPAQLVKGGEEDKRKRGGKPVGEVLLKPVPQGGKRGKFLVWFLEEGGVRTVREAMVEFGMTRSNVLSYLYTLNKDHGLGYSLVGDTAEVLLPSGCASPFDHPGEKEEEEEEDDSYLD